MLKSKIHSAKVPDQDGLTLLLQVAREQIPRPAHLRADTGYRGRGREWAERALSLSIEVVHRSPKLIPEKVLYARIRKWHKEGRSVNLDELLPRRSFKVLPRRWTTERTFAWISHNRRG